MGTELEIKKALFAGSLVIVLGVIGFLLFGINDEPVTSNVDIRTHEITIGTIHRDAAKMTDRFQPMANYIAEKLSNDTDIYVGRIIIPNTSEQMIEAINDKQIDIYFDSPIIGMKINQDANMTPVLHAWKEGVKSYHTVFFTSNSSNITSLEGLEGKTIVFEDPESSSGYFLPKYNLEVMGYTLGDKPPDNIFYKFSLDDENTPIWIIKGKGDVGALSNLDFEDIPINAKNQLRIIGTTKDIPRQIVFFRDSLGIKDKLLQIFLDMENDGIQELDSAKISKFSRLNIKLDLSQVKMMLDYPYPR